MDFNNSENSGPDRNSYPDGSNPGGGPNEGSPYGGYPNSGQNSYGSGPNPGQNPYGSPYRPPVRIPGGNFATTAMVFGIISIVTALMMTVYFPFIFGSLAILFALLSKGGAARLMKQAKTGITCAVIGLAANLIVVGSSVAFVLNNPDILRQTARMYDEMYEQVYGKSSEEIPGNSLENMVDEMLKQLR